MLPLAALLALALVFALGERWGRSRADVARAAHMRLAETAARLEAATSALVAVAGDVTEAAATLQGQAARVIYEAERIGNDLGQ